MALERLLAHCNVGQWPSEQEPVPFETLRNKAVGCAGLLTLLTDRVDETLLAKAPTLRIVANMAVGYDNIDVAACTRHGVAVTNTPDVLTESTADLTFALLMATARRLQEARKVIEDGEWKSWYPMMLTGQDVYGATLGIVGAGRIGQAVARRAQGFGMRILYHNRKPDPVFEAAHGATYCSLGDLLAEADHVVTLVPLTPQTHHLIGARELAQMKETAVLVNVSRGGVVDEQALYKALRSGQLFAAGSDVFENEPIAPDHPLLTLPNFTALPHIGSATVKTRTQMAVLAAENLVAGVTGRRPSNLVNPEVWGE